MPTELTVSLSALAQLQPIIIVVVVIAIVAIVVVVGVVVVVLSAATIGMESQSSVCLHPSVDILARRAQRFALSKGFVLDLHASSRLDRTHASVLCYPSLYIGHQGCAGTRRSSTYPNESDKNQPAGGDLVPASGSPAVAIRCKQVSNNVYYFSGQRPPNGIDPLYSSFSLGGPQR